jgi:hypothetical protein
MLYKLYTVNIKNRSSKHFICLTKIKPIIRCISNEQLNDWANKNIVGAQAEIKRRQKRQLKKSK